MVTPVIAIHGGAGTISRTSISPEMEQGYLKSLQFIAEEAQKMLLAGKSALDVVEYAVSLFEDDILFNAGRGSVYTSEAVQEMDACIMDGTNRKAGALTCVSRVKNPIKGARCVMENSAHVLMAYEKAEKFLSGFDVEFVEPEYFYSEFRMEQLKKIQQEQKPGNMVLDHDGKVDERDKAPLDEKNKFGTVGAVAIDINGNLAAATSTGGMTNKLPGRVGDTPFVGAGCYANDTVAVSTTGIGEFFMRQVTGHDISCRMKYLGNDLKKACEDALADLKALGGSGGLIAVDKAGNYELQFISEGMYRASAKGDAPAVVGIYR